METGGILPTCGSGSPDEAEACRAVTLLYRSWYIPLLRYASHRMRDRAQAEDLVHEAFMALYSDLREGKTVERPRAWLFVTVRRQLVNHYRRSSREKEWEQQEANLDERAAPATPRGMAGISGLFGVLSAREQEVLLLRISSLKYREIAQELGISANSVCQLLARAVRKLRKAVGEVEGRQHAQREW